MLGIASIDQLHQLLLVDPWSSVRYGSRRARTQPVQIQAASLQGNLDANLIADSTLRGLGG